MAVNMFTKAHGTPPQSRCHDKRILVLSLLSLSFILACSTEDSVDERPDASADAAHDAGKNATDAAFDAGLCGTGYTFMYLFPKPGCDESVQAVPLCVLNAIDASLTLSCDCDGNVSSFLYPGYGNPTRYKEYSHLNHCATGDASTDATNNRDAIARSGIGGGDQLQRWRQGSPLFRNTSRTRGALAPSVSRHSRILRGATCSFGTRNNHALV